MKDEEDPECTCKCDKNKYETEEAATKAAESLQEDKDKEVRVYLCLQSRYWHLATRKPNLTLLPMSRYIAIVLIRRKRRERSWIQKNLNIPIGSRGISKRRRYRRVVQRMENLGLLKRKGRYLVAVDISGLERVAQAGLDRTRTERLSQ